MQIMNNNNHNHNYVIISSDDNLEEENIFDNFGNIKNTVSLQNLLKILSEYMANLKNQKVII